MTEQKLRWYQGHGVKRLDEPPKFVPYPNLEDPAGYVAGSKVQHAVNVAIALGVPLLVTGEPGTGKTQLAWSVARELNAGDPLVFSAKTTSMAQDLFYSYDALGHFRASARPGADTSAWPHIKAEALGIAILRALPPSENRNLLLPAPYPQKPVRSVVLIDEIDKAPRDFPNDLLRDIETMSFTIRETRVSFPAADEEIDKSYRPIVIITSNSEKNLPDAFLRRCVFVHIPFPGEKDLERIVEKRFPDGWFDKNRMDAAIQAFQRVRGLPLKKKPATAEFLAWLHILRAHEIEPDQVEVEDSPALAHARSILAKDKDDEPQVESALRGN